MSTTFEHSPPEQDFSPEYHYREVSWPAVSGLVLGIGSLICFPFAMQANPTLPGAVLYAIVPLLGVACSIRGWIQVRRFAEDFTGAGLAQAGIVLSLIGMFSGWSWMGYVYATEVPDGYIRVHYSQLQPATESKRLEIPPSAVALDGQPVFIKGYMYPTDQLSGITEFLLCRDNGDCCFGGNPPLTERIYVRLKQPGEIEYSARIHKLAGTFRVQPSMQAPGVSLQDGTPGVVYHLENAERR